MTSTPVSSNLLWVRVREDLCLAGLKGGQEGDRTSGWVGETAEEAPPERGGRGGRGVELVELMMAMVMGLSRSLDWKGIWLRRRG